MDFNFDYWADLAKDDPIRFEEERKRVTTEVIESAPEHLQHRLRGLQWRVDVIRSTHKSLGATLVISQMMWESFFNLRDALRTAVFQNESIGEYVETPNIFAPVIPIRKSNNPKCKLGIICSQHYEKIVS